MRRIPTGMISITTIVRTTVAVCNKIAYQHTTSTRIETISWYNKTSCSRSCRGQARLLAVERERSPRADASSPNLQPSPTISDDIWCKIRELHGWRILGFGFRKYWNEIPQPPNYTKLHHHPNHHHKTSRFQTLWGPSHWKLEVTPFGTSLRP